jgi:hypothetical protein
VIGLAKTFKILTVALNRTETKLARDISSIEAPSSYHLRGIDGDRDVTGICITGNDVTAFFPELL